MKKIVLVLLSTISLTAFSQSVTQVRQFSGLNSVNYMINYNNKLYFAANDGQNGMELWTSDGTTAGTSLLKDILIGSASSSPEHLKVCGDKFYFIAKDPQNTSRKALYVSDGTSAGTSKIITLSADLAGIQASNYYQYFNGKVFFKHDDGTGFEFWSTDGTTTGTAIVRNIFQNAGSSHPDHFFEFMGKLYFNAEDALNGKELWASNGTSGGTAIVSTGNINTTLYGPRYFTAYNGYIYYEYDGELWRTDGTGANTSMFLQINPDFKSEPKNFLAYNGKLYFAAKRNGLAHELFVTDGTTTGTVPVLANMDGYYTSSLTEVSGKIFFSGNSDLNGQELWSSDGTAGNTELYYNLAADNPNVSSGLIVNNPMIAINDTLYLNASQNSTVQELFYTTGTDNALTRITFQGATSQDGEPFNFVSLNNQLYFIAKYTSAHAIYKVGPSQQAGLDEKMLSEQVIYPNPASEKLYLKSQKAVKEITIYALDGRFFTPELNYEENSIALTTLEAGSYVLNIRFEDDQFLTSKLIKL